MEDFEIDLFILGGFAEVIFLNELLRDIQKLDANIFGSIDRGLEIEVFLSQKKQSAHCDETERC